MQIVLLPGVGADRRLFDSLGQAGQGVVVPGWPEPKPAETLADYAARWAAEGRWATPLIVGGSSFGGMVAVELARHLHPAAVVLIGSCLHPSEIAQPLRFLRPLARVLPVPPLPTIGPAASVLTWYFGATSPATRQLFLEMLRGTSLAFLAWAIRAIASWDPAPLLTIPVRRIHGSRDRLISCPRAADVVVEGAGHLLPITHIDSLAAFLTETTAAARSTAGDGPEQLAKVRPDAP